MITATQVCRKTVDLPPMLGPVTIKIPATVHSFWGHQGPPKTNHNFEGRLSKNLNLPCSKVSHLRKEKTYHLLDKHGHWKWPFFTGKSSIHSCFFGIHVRSWHSAAVHEGVIGNKPIAHLRRHHRMTAISKFHLFRGYKKNTHHNKNYSFTKMFGTFLETCLELIIVWKKKKTCSPNMFPKKLSVFPLYQNIVVVQRTP